MSTRMPRSTSLIPNRASAASEGGIPQTAVPVWVSHSKSFGSPIRPYGRGKGLSIAASCNNMPGQMPVPPSFRRVIPQNHLGPHWGVNRGSFKAPPAPSDGVGGGRRG